MRELYRTPGSASHMLRPKNALFIAPNSFKHELAKFIGAYMLKKYGDIKFSEYLVCNLKFLEKEIKEIMKDFPKESSDFITEAVPINEPKRRVDLVRLSDNTRFEFETDKKVKKEGAITFYI